MKKRRFVAAHRDHRPAATSSTVPKVLVLGLLLLPAWLKSQNAVVQGLPHIFPSAVVPVKSFFSHVQSKLGVQRRSEEDQEDAKQPVRRFWSRLASVPRWIRRIQQAGASRRRATAVDEPVVERLVNKKSQHHHYHRFVEDYTIGVSNSSSALSPQPWQNDVLSVLPSPLLEVKDVELDINGVHNLSLTQNATNHIELAGTTGHVEQFHPAHPQGKKRRWRMQRKQKSSQQQRKGFPRVRGGGSAKEESKGRRKLRLFLKDQIKINNMTLQERRIQFLDRIALISSTLLVKQQEEDQVTQKVKGAGKVSEPEEIVDLDAVTPQSDLTRPGRTFCIVTTAALPWFTGTAVNPLLRAAYLHRYTVNLNRRSNAGNNNNNNNNNSSDGTAMDTAPSSYVTLAIPWLELTEDQVEVFGAVKFQEKSDQEAYIRAWLRDEANMPDVADVLNIVFYPARYHTGLRSIFAMGDIMSLLLKHQQQITMSPNAELDVCILEEPEHCNWFRAPGDGWTQQFQYVVGIVHTNYKEYAATQYTGLWTAPALAMISSAMVRAYCHQVLKLSDTLQTYAPEKEHTVNVHGVRSVFIETGLRRAQVLNATRMYRISTQAGENVMDIEGVGGGGDDFTFMVGENHDYSTTQPSTEDTRAAEPDEKTQIYFIGKLLWAKGLDLMLELQEYYKQCTGQYFPIDIYGSGPDSKDIQRAFHGRQRKDNKDAKTATTDDVANDKNNNGGRERNVASSSTIGTMFGTDRIQILGTTLSLGGLVVPKSGKTQAGSVSNGNEGRENVTSALPQYRDQRDNASADLLAAVSVYLASLDNLQVKAKERLNKLKETIQTVEIPKTFSELLRRQPIPAHFPGRVDHAELGSDKYKIFVNPSISEVLCTTTAEALAMGKFAIIPYHPSNTFFYQFPNCLPYRNKLEFVANLRWAMTHDPEPLTPQQAHEFSWEAATDRLIQASAITWREAKERERLGLSKLDERIAWFHNEIGKGATGDVLRMIFGAGPASNQVQYIEHQTRRLEAVETSTVNETETQTGVSVEDEGVSDESESSSDGLSDYEEDEDDGLTKKFRRSSFAEAIRATITDISKLTIQ